MNLLDLNAKYVCFDYFDWFRLFAYWHMILKLSRPSPYVFTLQVGYFIQISYTFRI